MISTDMACANSKQLICDGADCSARCGWNQEEAARRKARIATNGLTTCKCGLRRLILAKVKTDEGH